MKTVVALALSVGLFAAGCAHKQAAKSESSAVTTQPAQPEPAKPAQSGPPN